MLDYFWKRSRSSLFFLLIGCLLPTLAMGTVVLYMSLEDMSQVSDVIVHAKVIDSSVLADESRPITTRTTLETITVFKGDSFVKDNRLWFDLLGGKRGEMEIRVPGSPTFRAGEELLLFLEKNDTDYALCGLQQGVFRVLDSHGEKTVNRNLDGAGFARFEGQTGAFKMMHSVPRGVQGFPMKNLIAELQLLLSAQKKVTP